MLLLGLEPPLSLYLATIDLNAFTVDSQRKLAIAAFHEALTNILKKRMPPKGIVSLITLDDFDAEEGNSECMFFVLDNDKGAFLSYWESFPMFKFQGNKEIAVALVEDKQSENANGDKDNVPHYYISYTVIAKEEIELWLSTFFQQFLGKSTDDEGKETYSAPVAGRELVVMFESVKLSSSQFYVLCSGEIMTTIMSTIPNMEKMGLVDKSNKPK